MSIAIFRHLKLTAAVPLERYPTVLNFSPRRLRGLSLDVNKEGIWTTRIGFTMMQRQLGLLKNLDMVWEFQNDQFHVIHQWRRNGSLVREERSPLFPAYSHAWTENGIIQPVYEQFEQEISSQVIAERYLHEHVPNPYEYKIVQMDFSPKVVLLGRPQYRAHLVRSPQAVELAAAMDTMENAKAWEELFLH